MNVGHAQVGFNAFLDKYLDSLLTNGRAVGEIVPDAEGREIAAVLCHRVEQLALREGETALDAVLRLRRGGEAARAAAAGAGAFHAAAAGVGESLRRVAAALDALYGGAALAHLLRGGQNWERCGNVRFAVVYKPQGEEPDGALAQEYRSARCGDARRSVRDFVSVGDVSIRAIGADNVMPDCEVPVRQILEQLVAKTGLPPFLLGLSWSSTERMSSQQADMLTSEITALRRTLTPMVERVCRLWLRLHGYGLPLCRGVGRHQFAGSCGGGRRSCTASRRAGSDWKMTRGRNRLERERKGSGHRRDGGGAGVHQPLCEEGAARGGGRTPLR